MGECTEQSQTVSDNTDESARVNMTKELEDLNVKFLFAAEKGSTRLCLRLIGSGAEVDYLGNQPLIRACTNGHAETVLLLLDHGADFNCKDGSGASVLHLAAKGSDIQICQELIEFGADINVRDKDGATPLHFVRLPEICRLFLGRGADIGAVDDDGQTPLHCASRQGQGQVCAILLEYGPNINCVDKTGQTPLHQAATADVCLTLLERGANINCVDKIGQTPLHKAVTAAEVDRILALIANGAIVDVSLPMSIDSSLPPEIYQSIRRILNASPLQAAATIGYLPALSRLLMPEFETSSKIDSIIEAIALAKVAQQHEAVELLKERLLLNQELDLSMVEIRINVATRQLEAKRSRLRSRSASDPTLDMNDPSVFDRDAFYGRFLLEGYGPA